MAKERFRNIPSLVGDLVRDPYLQDQAQQER